MLDGVAQMTILQECGDWVDSIVPWSVEIADKDNKDVLGLKCLNVVRQIGPKTRSGVGKFDTL